MIHSSQRRRELGDWLRLCGIPGLGGGGQRALLKRFGLPSEIFTASPADIAAVVGEALANEVFSVPSKDWVTPALEWTDAPGHSLITLDDPAYPQRLLELPDPPTLLFAKGNPEVLHYPSIAIVGSRNATPGGCRDAEHFGRDLAQQGFCVASGLALGIDGAAHQGALDAGGATIAVVGTGIDRIYPARNAALARAIVASPQGCILSELPLGAGPLAHHFPRRNRIISGLSVGVLVVEAAVESGSLITARLAGEQGREVFAIPGSIHSPQSRGCHRLIREGAKLVESAADILSELPALSVGRHPFPNANAPAAGNAASCDTNCFSPENLRVLGVLGRDPLTADELVSRCGLTADAVLAMLFELEMAGAVAQLPGARYQRL